jgi:hypothetical protein
VDLPLVVQERNYLSRGLTYFGLPSEGLYDVLEWRDYLSRIVAVEKGEPHEPARKQALLMANAIRLGLARDLVLLRGEINKIIIEGKDDYGARLEFPFELCNFDYGGSLLYPDRVRVDALETFVLRQRPFDFLIFITTNAREFDHPELDETMERVKAEISQLVRPRPYPELDAYCEWIRSKSIREQVLHVLYLFKNIGEFNRYHVHAYPPVLYEGSKQTQLLHYAFTFRFQRGASTRVVSPQGLRETLNLPLRLLKNGELLNTEHQVRL